LQATAVAFSFLQPAKKMNTVIAKNLFIYLLSFADTRNNFIVALATRKYDTHLYVLLFTQHDVQAEFIASSLLLYLNLRPAKCLCLDKHCYGTIMQRFNAKPHSCASIGRKAKFLTSFIAFPVFSPSIA
jgi:hypothetical protein